MGALRTHRLPTRRSSTACAAPLSAPTSVLRTCATSGVSSSRECSATGSGRVGVLLVVACSPGFMIQQGDFCVQPQVQVRVVSDASVCVTSMPNKRCLLAVCLSVFSLYIHTRTCPHRLLSHTFATLPSHSLLSQGRV